MGVEAVCCTRSEFDAYVRELSLATAWEVHSRQSALGTTFHWLDATYNISATPDAGSSSLPVTVYLVYNPDFRVPQLGFFASTLVSVEELQAALPNLSFVSTVLERSSAVDAVSTRPLVSCGWNDEAAQHMWVVHPCDTENLIRRARHRGAHGDLLTVFVQAMSPFFPLAPSLLSPAACSPKQEIS